MSLVKVAVSGMVYIGIVCLSFLGTFYFLIHSNF